MKSPVNSDAWFVKFAAIALFIIPFALLKIELNSTLRVIAVFLIGVVTPLAFLKFAFKTAAIQANQDLRAPCGVLSSGFQGTAKMPKLMTLPGFTLLMTVGPSASLSILLEYPFRTTGMLLGITIGCLWSFATIWIIWRFMTMAELQNMQCAPGVLYDAFGQFSSPNAPQNSSSATHDGSADSSTTTKTKKSLTKKSAKAKLVQPAQPTFEPPSEYRDMAKQHADHHFQRGMQHAQRQYILQELQQQRVARQVQRQAASGKSSVSFFNPFSILKR